MHSLLLALHLVFAVFAVGPLVHAATTASRGVRGGDGTAVAASSRMLKLYSYASVLTIVFGFGLMSSKEHGKTTAEFSETWIWLSALLWLVAVALVLGLLVPALDKVGGLITEQQSVVSQTGRIAALGGVVAVLFVVIVFLMAYQPGH